MKEFELRNIKNGGLILIGSHVGITNWLNLRAPDELSLSMANLKEMPAGETEIVGRFEVKRVK